MTLTKKIVLAVASLLLVVLVGMAWLVLTFDANRYKSVAVDWMREHKQRTLSIGDIKLGVFPRLQVELSQVALSEFKQPEQRFVALESARLSVQLLPLLHKQLVVDEVAAKGLTLRYHRDADGKRNIDDLLQPSAPTPADTSPSAPLRFDINAVQLEQLQLQLDDELGHLHGQVALASLKTGRLNPDVVAPVSLVAEAQLTEPKLNAKLSGSLQLQFDPGDGAKRPLKLTTRQVALQLGLDAGPLQLKDSTLALDRFELLPAEQRFTISQLALRLQGGLQGGAQRFKVDLRWPQLAIHGQQLQGSDINGNFELQGPTALQGTLSSGLPSGSFDAIRLRAFKLAFGVASSGANASRLNGTIQTDIEALTETKQITLGGLTIDASVQNPAIKPLKIDAKGQIEASPQHAHWQLAGQMNAQAFSSDGQLTLGGKVPQLQAQAKFGELDLDALLPPRPAEPASAPKSSADVPVDLSGLHAINAKVDLQAGLLKYQPFVIHDLVASATLENGTLKLAPLRLKTWDGTLDALLQADAGNSPAQQRLGLQATAQNIQIQALLKDVAKTDLLDGRGRVTLDVHTGGASVNAFKAALNGSAALQLRDGAIKGINLAQKLREFKATLSLQSDAVQQARQTEKTDFSELSASFQIKDGVASNHDLDMKSPFLRLGGDGQVNLPKGSLDYTARATVAATATGQGGADLSALKGVTVPVHLSGPFDALGWKIDWSGVAAGAAGNTLKQAGDQLKSKATEQLQAAAADKLGLKASGAAASAPLQEQLKDKARDEVKNRLQGLFK
ncbi:MAG: AsmA family protein [Leptothrix sp. (in: b-proteobacteria)]